jgi:predicted ATPase
VDTNSVALSSRGLTTSTVVRTDRQRAAFERQVRDALNHLFDPGYLQTHPLARLIRADQLTSAAPGGKDLRRALLEAIEALHPITGGSASDRADRCYQILLLRYGEAMDPQDVQARLGISRAAFYRGQKRGIGALADYLWERSRPANQAGKAADRVAARGQERDPPADRLAVGSRPTYRIPVPLTSFIGREAEIAEITRLVSTTRLLTLTGAGGCGKTRLALRVAADLVEATPDGVAFVELASLADPALLAQTVAVALGVALKPGPSPLVTLVGELRPRHLLLVLDNCEHLIDACATLAQTLLEECPHLQILATTREALRIPGETDLLVPPLATPDPATLPHEPSALVAVVHASEAGQLFLERATSARSDFALTPTNAHAVASIGWRLDGIPLAIELAAARVKHLAVDQIAARLDDRFRLLTGGSRGVLARHQTLRALVDWSYDLLAEPERVLFRRLSVFAGGWTLEAAEAVGAGSGIAGADVVGVLSRLVDQSLVVLERGGEGADRYRLLETLRQYARERLATSGEADGRQEAHAAFFLTLAEQMRATGWDQYKPVHLDPLEAEHDNLRAAYQWFADRGDAERSLRLSNALGTFWFVRGYLTEGQSWLGASLGRSIGLSAKLRAEALGNLGRLALARGDLEVAATFVRESVAIWRQLGDRRRLAEALFRLGNIARDQCSYPEALAALEESLRISQEYDDRFAIARNLGQLGLLARQQSQLPRARSLLENALTIHRAFDLPRSIGATLLSLGLVAEDQGDYPRAQSLYQESVALLRLVNDRWHLAFLFEAFASLAVARGDLDRGAVLSGVASALRRQIGSSVPRSVQPQVDRAVRLAREGLGEAAFGKAWAQGQAMTLEQAIAYALEEEDTRS